MKWRRIKNTLRALALIGMISFVGLAHSGDQLLTLRQPDGKANFRGGLLTVSWYASGLAKDDPLQIGLYRGETKVQNIALQGNQLQTWTTWNIPKNFAKGTYTVRVVTESGNFSNISPPFDITDGAIEILNPRLNSLWVVGGTYTISWEADIFKWPDHIQQNAAFDESKEAEISLVSKGSTSSIILLENINDFRTGYFNWFIPSTTTPGTYVLKIKSNDGKFFGESKTFTIVPSIFWPEKFFGVATPEKDSWSTGTTKTFFFHWSYNSDFSQVSSKVNITLRDMKGEVINKIASNLEYKFASASQQLVEWKIPTDIKNGLYRIQVDTTDGKRTGSSDILNIFTLKVYQGLLPLDAKAILNRCLPTAKNTPTIQIKDFYPPWNEQLKITMKVKSIKINNENTMNSIYYGETGLFGSIDIVLEVEANNPFRFSEIKNLTSGNIKTQFSLAALEVTLEGKVLRGPSAGSYSDDPTGRMPYKRVFKLGPDPSGPGLDYPTEIIPKGKSIITIVAGEKQTGLFYFYALDVIRKIAYTQKKCIQHLVPEISVIVKCTTRQSYIYVPDYSMNNWVPSKLRENTFGYSEIFQHPKTLVTVDTTLHEKDLGFLPDWTTPYIFDLSECDRLYQPTLIGGW